MNKDKNKSDIKKFLIKLAAITFAIIIIINVTYNLIFAEKLENINKLLMLNNKESIDNVKDKIRLEINTLSFFGIHKKEKVTLCTMHNA